MKQPEITQFSWGSIEVQIGAEKFQFRDCKIWPGGAAEWNWNETGTHHTPGIQPADILEILAYDPEVMILTRGVLRRLKICPETEQLLNSADVEWHFIETRQAVRLYRNLIGQGKRVGGVFHTTC